MCPHLISCHFDSLKKYKRISGEGDPSPNPMSAHKSYPRQPPTPYADHDPFDGDTYGAWNPFKFEPHTPRAVSYSDFEDMVACALVVQHAEGLPCGNVYRVYDAIPNDAAAEWYKDASESIVRNAIRARYARDRRLARPVAAPLLSPPIYERRDNDDVEGFRY